MRTFHDYLTVDGRKISKSAGPGVDPVALTTRYGTDAVRWWLLRDVPRVGDADFTVARLVTRANEDLAGGVGNLVSRVVTMVHRYRDGNPGAGPVRHDEADELHRACVDAPRHVDDALYDFDFRRALAAVWTIVEQANRLVERVRPWELSRAERDGDTRSGVRLDEALGVLVDACRQLGENLEPFVPGLAAGIRARCTPVGGRLPAAEPLFARIEEP